LLIVVGASGLAWVVLTIVYGNAALALQDTGQLMQVAGIGIAVFGITASIVRQWRGGKEPPHKDE
jgi:hypothetical protein